MKIIKNQGLLILNYGYGLWLWCLMAAVNGMAMSFQKTWTATAENEWFSPKILKERFQDIEVENLRNFEALRQIFRHRWTDGLIVADSIQSFGVPNTSCNENWEFISKTCRWFPQHIGVKHRRFKQQISGFLHRKAAKRMTYSQLMAPKGLQSAQG